MPCVLGPLRRTKPTGRKSMMVDGLTGPVSQSSAVKPSQRLPMDVITSYVIVVESEARPEFGVTGPLDLPVEFLYTKEELQSAAAKPQLCSISGLREYPACNL
ncbi:abdominal ganglion neuropeptides L5-67 precursor [Elysia marginata]|uniref:Abdominal ganglion neuropeptides L5-67 n=1 Tax=Elysia marginata TaxID=1093978 RepID=A0AAV4HNM5_9GAST|nr:abdominal ganglion neuropeptides L5-67 precursor [Elysia marginata]